MKKKWMKKASVCFFTLLGILLILEGCFVHKDEAAQKTKLRVAIFDGAYDVSYWEEIAKEFEEVYPEVHVELDINANIGNILLPRMDVKDVPDVVYLSSSNNSGYTQRMIEKQMLAPLDDVLDEQMQAQFLDNILSSKLLRPYADERLYLAPLYYNVTGLWYNEELFDKYGYEVPQTWDEFFALGDQAKADGIDLFLYQGLNPTYLEAMLWPMLAEQIGEDGLEAIFQLEENAWSQDGVLEVLRVFERMHDGGYMSDDTIILTYMEAQKRFIQGEALFIPCGNWLLQEMAQEIEDTTARLMFMNVPSFASQDHRYATVMVEQIYVPKDAQQLDLGKAFVAFQFQKENAEKNVNMSGGYVPVKDVAGKDTTAQPFTIFNQGVTPITAAFKQGSDTNFYDEVFEELSKVLAGDISSEDMIHYLNQRSADIK